MPKPRDRDGFACEASARFLRPLKVRVHDLERHVSIEPRIACLVHRGHAPMADFADNFVLPYTAQHGRSQVRVAHYATHFKGSYAGRGGLESVTWLARQEVGRYPALRSGAAQDTPAMLCDVRQFR